MFEQVIKILSDYTNINIVEIKEDSTLTADLDLSSLDVVSIVTEFEDQYGIEIPDREIGKFFTVGDILRYLEAHT